MSKNTCKVLSIVPAIEHTSQVSPIVILKICFGEHLQLLYLEKIQ